MKAFRLWATLAALASGSVQAGDASTPEIFDGIWVGKGVYHTRDKTRFCDLSRFVFEATPTSLAFSGGRECEDLEERFDKVEMRYAGGKLLYGDHDVGDVTGNLMTAGYVQPDPEGGVRIWRSSMRRQGSTLVYEESRTMQGETEPKIVFAGVMQRQE